MKHHSAFVAILAALALAATGCSSRSTSSNQGKFTSNIDAVVASKAPAGTQKWPAPAPLFAADLANADFKPGSWAWKDGALAGSGIIWTKAVYGDFYMSCEFRCDAGKDGGVLIRGGTEDWVNNSIEVQIAHGDRTERAITGAIFDCLAPTRDVGIEPGKWYQYVIFAKGDRISVFIDGEQVIKNMNLSKWTEAGKNPDGTKNKFKKAYKDLERTGRIGLQSQGGGVQYRNIFIDPI
ncbi:MAG: DUF1080 domain-containing protein [Opitutaceae bacterium]|jgi:hypothetical protein|nr:DUF1080 domain-containing protein [Opitutaceae bacterium]